MQLRHLIFLLSAAGITACGSEPLYPELELAPASAAELTPTGGEALAEHLKNGMRLQLRENSRPSGGGWGGWGSGGSPAPPTPTPAPTPTPGGFSGTNVHVAGIDEADIVKYDGENWFIAARAGTENFQHHPNPQLLVARLDPTAPSAEMIAQHSFSDEFGIAEMYLTNEGDARQLAILRQKRGNVVSQTPAWGGGFAFTRAYPDNGQLRLSLVDVSDPAKPAETHSITIDGTVIDSRRIGDTLYLMTRFDPWLEALVYDGGASGLRDANEATLVAAPLTALLPHVDEGAGDRPLTETCLLPADREPHHGFAPMVFVSTIDLAAGKLQSSTCISAQVSSLSMFSESLYVTGLTPVGNTVLHKFKVDEAGLEYIAAGEVAGSIVNGLSDPVFRLDERDGYLRVVSTRNGASGGGANAVPPPVPQGPVHQLTVLEQQGERLVTVAQLPNESRPDPIGKPRENIYSVRFEEDTAYLVTFQRTDPLYAIDLSDPLDPRIAGELEIPGYATYMHPLAGDYLFTLGMNASQSGVVDGLKFELVKVEDGEPRVVDSILMPEAYSSEALTNLRALSVLQVSEQQYRFALPVLLRPGEQDYYSQAEHALQLLEVNLGEEAIIDGGQISGGMDQNSVQRGLLQDDAVFYASGRQVLAAPFAAPEAAIAAGDPPSEVICGPAESRPSFVLDLALGDAPFASCPSLDMLHRRGVSREALVLEGELEDGECRYEGPMLRAGLYTTHLEQPGYYGELLALAVYAEACDIVPVAERVVLRPLPEPVPCDLEPQPSISLLVELGDGEGDACAAAVTVLNISTLAQHTLTGEPAEGGCRFDGPYEQAGSFQVTVAAAGYQSQTLSTYVPRLVCSVETRELTVVLESNSAD